MEQHGKLELLMNPSEKDHRALMALIRHIYGHHSVRIDMIPRTELGFTTLVPSNPADRSALKSQMIRLSNVVLKREWERVKRITLSHYATRSLSTRRAGGRGRARPKTGGCGGGGRQFFPYGIPPNRLTG
jgi:hypothetical protein